MDGLDSSTASIREGRPSDVDRCVALWVEACAVRDRYRHDGVAERARPEFDRPAAWLISEDGAELAGFVLAMPSAQSEAAATKHAVTVGLLAVAPNQHGRGAGRALLRAVTERLRRDGIETPSCTLSSTTVRRSVSTRAKDGRRPAWSTSTRC